VRLALQATHIGGGYFSVYHHLFPPPPSRTEGVWSDCYYIISRLQRQMALITAFQPPPDLVGEGGGTSIGYIVKQGQLLTICLVFSHAGYHVP
jgi:hypothetical protein